MPLQDDYQVRLDAFCGPLDLLLYLIRRAEVDIHDIPIAEITEQYLRFLEGIDEIDIEAAGEFLVMAASLMEIKSRTLMPPEAQEAADGDAQEGRGTDGGGEPADPRYELVRQLLEYQRFRLAAEELADRRREFSRQYAAGARMEGPQPQEQPEPGDLELEDAHVYDLYEAYDRIVAAIDFDRMGDHRVEIDHTPPAAYQQELLERLERAGGSLTLQAAFEGCDRLHRVGLFLAMLELVRLRRIVVRQEDLLSDITVGLTGEPQPVGDEPA